MTERFDVATAPGHLIRRAQQIAVSIFADQLAAFGITPVQFAIMNALRDTPDIDQVTLAKRVDFDPATSGSVIGRLEAKGWVARQAHPTVCVVASNVKLITQCRHALGRLLVEISVRCFCGKCTHGIDDRLRLVFVR
jgi:hypothetical protein